VEHVLRIARDERWAPTRYSVTDLRTVTKMSLPNEHVLDALVDGTEMRETVEQVILVRPGVDCEALSDAARSLGLRPRFFVDFDQACEHLGIDAAQLQATIARLRSELERHR
jgi:hypothetical protein